MGLALAAAVGDPAGATEADVAAWGATEAELAAEAAVAGEPAVAGDVPGAMELPGFAGAGDTAAAGAFFFNSRLSELPPILWWA